MTLTVPAPTFLSGCSSGKAVTHGKFMSGECGKNNGREDSKQEPLTNIINIFPFAANNSFVYW